MHAAVSLPITIKCRLGVDDADSDDLLDRFIEITRAGGCDVYYIHARKALLKGLSPAQNRSVPPLQYGRAYRLRERFPDLCFIINGGIETNEQVREHLTRQDGVMVGRAAYHNPLRLADMHALIFGGEPADSHALLSGYRAHIERELAAGTRLADMTRHALGLFAGSPGARRWRRLMSDAARLRANDIGLIDEALEMIEPMAA